LRVLHLTPELPVWPGGAGGATRQFHLLARLAELGHEPAVVAPATPGQVERVGDLQARGVRAVIARRPPSRVLETARAIARDPRLVPQAAMRPVLAWQVSVFWRELRPLALRAAAELRPDVLSVEHDNAAAWARDLPAALPAVLTLQNLGWRYYESRAAAAGGAAAAALRLEARRFRRFDERHAGRYARLVAMSDADAAGLSPLGRPVDVVPNGVATAELPLLEPAGHGASLLFTGTMAYPPNAEGIAWFAREAWPLVRAEVPDATLTVVGRNPPASVRRLGEEPGIHVTGTVADVRPYFGRATAVVAPVLSGGGTRLKLLEAWSQGRAVVATTQAAAGLEHEPGRHLLLEDDPAGFAAAAVRLLREPELRERLAASGRRLVEERYDWRALGERFAAALEAAAG
jgi:glycosyltransferase involved in cell wall biosynthesis